MANKVYVGDVGTAIRVDMQEDISSATGYILNVKFPDGTEDTWDCTIYGTDYFQHVTGADDLPLAGTYYIQPEFTLSGWVGLGHTVELIVYAPYK